VFVAAAVAAYCFVEADRLRFVVAGFGAVSLVLLSSGLAKGRAQRLVTALAGIGGCWTLSAWTQGSGVPGGTILVAAGIFVAAELAFASLEQVPVPDEPELFARRLAGIAARGVAVVVLATVLLAALGLNAGGGLALECVGVAAAIGVLLLVFALRRAGEAPAER
jgi:hypothetical protein